MQTKLCRVFVVFVFITLATADTRFSACFGQGTAFTYQGRLNVNGTTTGGLYDFRFKLYSDPLGDTQAGSSYITNAIPVNNGLFTVAIDFGPGIFTGSNYWLEVDVKTNNAGAYTDLNPLQPLTPAPYAVFANTASNLSGALPAAQIVGPVPAANISGTYNNAVTLNNSGNNIAGSFTGNGAGVTNVNAATLNGLPAAGFWQTGGNNVTAGQILGSTNSQPLAIDISGQRALLITTNPGDSANIVAGAAANLIDPGIEGGVIAGGGTTNFSGMSSGNHLSANFGLIGGGSGNWIQAGADHAAVIAGWNNTIASGAYESVIAGGENNSNGSHWVFLGAGTLNVIQPGADYSVLGGGYDNNIQSGSAESFIGGGYANTIQTNSNDSVIGGGYQNTIQQSDYEATIAGGGINTIQSGNEQSTIAGGLNNAIQYGALVSAIGGGDGNIIETNAEAAVIAGGFLNTNGGYISAILGGQQNTIQILADHSVIAGGYLNTIIGSLTVNVYDFIGGGYANLIQTNTQYGTISGGISNLITAGTANGTIGGGSSNYVNGVSGTVGGGDHNEAMAFHDTVGGGFYNMASGGISTVAGGWTNVASGNGATVGGGGFNLASGLAATIGGGQFNQSTNLYTVVPGGNGNIAGGAASFAAGDQAQALHSGAFVWADAQGPPFASTAANQFNVRAGGGVRFVTGGAGMTLDGAQVLTNTSTGVSLGGAFSGTLSGSATTATGFTGSLAGDVTGTQGATVVAQVDGVSASSVSNAVFDVATLLNAGSSSTGYFFTGPNAGHAVNSSASYDTGGGYYSLYRNTSGSFNTAFGYQTLYYTTTGSYNTAFGYDALWGLGNAPSSAGYDNIGIGYMGGANLSGSESNNIEIGNKGVDGENDMIRIGTPGTQTNAVIAGVVTATGGLQVGTGGTAVTFMEYGQAIMPSSNTQETNFTIAFPTAFSSSPKILFTIANDPGFQGVSDVFASSVSSNSPAAFSINVYRLNGTGWSQALRINWKAWQ